ncbi:glycosyltransferase [Desulfosarcina sp. OttesenSCG-928-G10]|nr:glycosyltransferase [Desulfosarcina sp. OttesenSCG-928-G10]MDL2321958.1 glycosyltransferase [Desulfosarcina sp. OttesenSCG-928-B08]
MNPIDPACSPLPENAGWDFFDRIYCISLSTRPDRRRQAQAQFDAVGLGDRVRFFLAAPHPTNSEQGIYASHLASLSQGLSEGAETILIFEDDVVFQGFSKDRLRNAIAFLTRRPWQAFFLGCLMRRAKKTDDPSVIAVQYQALTHAYAVTRSFALQITRKPWQGIPYDAMLARFDSAGFFAACPGIAFQGDATSDNARLKRLDRIRRCCGGLIRIQKANQWLCLNTRLLLAIHLGIPAAVMIVLLFLYR